MEWMRDRLWPGRAMSEEALFQRMSENEQPSPEQISENKKQNLLDLLSVIPGPGNVIAAHDAGKYGAETAKEVSEGNYRRGALLAAMTGLSTLGAATGIPFTRGASPAANAATMRFGPATVADALPADAASRMARAKQMGYADDVFYRGEKSGNLPTHGEPVYYSRDKNYADGFAHEGGLDSAREFRLNLDGVLQDRKPMTAEKYGRLVEAAQKTDPKLAHDLAETIAPGKGADWVVGFGKARPDFIVADSPALIRHAIEVNASNPVGLFRAAGINALDSGRDVKMLHGNGARLAEAMFDPARKNSRDLMAGVAGAVALPTGLAAALTSRQGQTEY